MLEKPKRPKQLSNQERKIPANIQELITRYDLENKEIYDYLDKLVSTEILNFVYPIGSIFISVNDTNPSNFLGGTWVQWGAGKTIIGVDSEDTDFDTAENTGGEKTHTLTVDEIPAHNHRINTNNDDWNNSEGGGNFGTTHDGTWNFVTNNWFTQNAGGGQAHNNLPPYITCYIWKRTS